MSAPPGTQHAAFLGGINLGRRRLSNDELRAAFERIGLPGASTFRASGNVAFSGAGAGDEELERQIEDGLRGELGWEVPAWVRSAGEVHAIAAREPFSASELAQTAGRVQVCLLKRPPAAAAREEALALGREEDRLMLEGRELYWLPRSGVSDSPLDTVALRGLLGAMTVRTLGTVSQFAARHLDPRAAPRR